MAVVATVERAVVDRLAGVHGGPSLVFVNGVFAESLSDIDPPLPGVWLGDATGGHGADLFYAEGDVAPSPGAGLAAVVVDDEVTVDEPIHIVHVRDPRAPGGDDARTVVRIGRAATVCVIESYVAVAGPADTESTTRIHIDSDARVRLHRFVRAEADSTHIDRLDVHQESASELRSTSVLLDGAHVQSNVGVTLAGAGARFDADGLHAPTGNQLHEHLLVVDHAAVDCVSDQRFKGIVDEHGHGVFASHVIVRHGAAGSDSNQSNPNLVLSTSAQADTRPWLEILADDVTCTHGATVGRIDDEALFYMRSRGIPAADATALLIEAFASDVLSAVELDSLRSLLRAGLDRDWAVGLS